jgi:hypothetical protein
MRTHDTTLEDLRQQLATIESLVRDMARNQISSRIVLTRLEKDIVAVVSDKSLKASAIASRLNCRFNSQFRATLSFLVRAGLLEKTLKGYAPAEGSVICMKPASAHTISTET